VLLGSCILEYTQWKTISRIFVFKINKARFKNKCRSSLYLLEVLASPRCVGLYNSIWNSSCMLNDEGQVLDSNFRSFIWWLNITVSVDSQNYSQF
jgi:hypothetical protein